MVEAFYSPRGTGDTSLESWYLLLKKGSTNLENKMTLIIPVSFYYAVLYKMGNYIVMVFHISLFCVDRCSEHCDIVFSIQVKSYTITLCIKAFHITTFCILIVAQNNHRTCLSCSLFTPIYFTVLKGKLKMHINH